MIIPTNVHFGLGFGFKYQYLLSVLLHGLMSNQIDRNKYESCKKYMIKKLSENTHVHANVNYFMQQISRIFPNIEQLNYNTDSFLLLEGEDGCFEDINIFTTSNESKIHFIQVKGSDGETTKGSLNRAVKKTLVNMLKNENTDISFELIILINEELTNWYYLNTNTDRIKMINTIFDTLLPTSKRKLSSFLRNKILTICESYLEHLYWYGSTADIHTFFSQNSTAKQYNKIKVILDADDELLIKSFFKLKLIIDNTKILKRLDHRLIYLFLKFYYGNDKLTKILWNIEMKSMSGVPVDINFIKNKLDNINFDQDLINQITFSKKLRNNMFNKGKIL